MSSSSSSFDFFIRRFIYLLQCRDCVDYVVSDNNEINIIISTERFVLFFSLFFWFLFNSFFVSNSIFDRPIMCKCWYINTEPLRTICISHLHGYTTHTCAYNIDIAADCPQQIHTLAHHGEFILVFSFYGK